MAATGKKIDSLRLSRFESERLVLALLISLAAHLLTWGGYEAGNREFGWLAALAIALAGLAASSGKNPAAESGAHGQKFRADHVY
jgi:hypothetical protein